MLTQGGAEAFVARRWEVFSVVLRDLARCATQSPAFLADHLALSAADLIDCFEWPWSSDQAKLEAGFGQSSVAEWLEVEHNAPRRRPGPLLGGNWC